MAEHDPTAARHARPGNPNWQPGVSGNPAGRPRGARGRRAEIFDALLEQHAEGISRTVMALAAAGNLQALRLCVARLSPPLRERTVSFEMPRLTSAADAAPAMDTLLQAVAQGELAPSEAATLSRIVRAAARAFAREERARRAAVTPRAAPVEGDRPAARDGGAAAIAH